MGSWCPWFLPVPNVACGSGTEAGHPPSLSLGLPPENGIMTSLGAPAFLQTQSP